MPITKQTITFIGPQNNFTSALAKNIGDRNYRLLFCDKNGSNVHKLCKEITDYYPNTDMEYLNCSHLASWESDIVILMTDKKQTHAVASKIKDVLTQKIVCVMRDFAAQNNEENGRRLFSNSKVVWIMETSSNGNSTSVRIMTEYEEALKTVIELVAIAGFYIESVQVDAN